jgi:hypothetical protein
MRKLLVGLFLLCFVAATAFAQSSGNYANPSAPSSITVLRAHLVLSKAAQTLKGDKRAQAVWTLTCLTDYQISKNRLDESANISVPKEVLDRCVAAYSNATEKYPSPYTRTPFQSPSEHMNSMVIAVAMMQLVEEFKTHFVENAKLYDGVSCLTDFLRLNGDVTEDIAHNCMVNADPILNAAPGVSL